jgi:hypothetical protein
MGSVWSLIWSARSVIGWVIGWVIGSVIGDRVGPAAAGCAPAAVEFGADREAVGAGKSSMILRNGQFSLLCHGDRPFRWIILRPAAHAGTAPGPWVNSANLMVR